MLMLIMHFVGNCRKTNLCS